MLGIPCQIYRSKDIVGGGVSYDEFDRPVVSGAKARALHTMVIIEVYQEPMQRIHDNKGRFHERFPYVGTFRFADDIQRLDLVDIAYEYARAAGLTNCLWGDVVEPSTVYYTRFKLVSRVTTGINADLMNKFYLVPTEEDWS